MQRHKGEYIVPGPNYLWSIDGYAKLNAWGIEIYAAIDAYSRKIIWIYVGISARTAVSVLRQYLDTLENEKIHPCILRSDRGGETPLIASAHHEFVKKHDNTVAFKHCYYYGTSTKNVRVEKWWGYLTGSQLFTWQVSILYIYILNIYIYSNIYIGLFSEIIK